MTRATQVQALTLDPPSRLTTGEARLIFALLRQTLKDAMSRNATVRRVAVEWIADDARNDQWSFNFSCEFFGYSAAGIRERLLTTNGANGGNGDGRQYDGFRHYER